MVHIFLQCVQLYVTTNTDHMRTTDTMIRLFIVILIVAYYRDGVIIILENNIMILINHHIMWQWSSMLLALIFNSYIYTTGGGGTLSFSCYMGSAPASTVNREEISGTPKTYRIFMHTLKYIP